MKNKEKHIIRRKTRLEALLALVIVVVCFSGSVTVVGVVSKALSLFFFGIVHNAVLSWFAALAIAIPVGMIVFLMLLYTFATV